MSFWRGFDPGDFFVPFLQDALGERIMVVGGMRDEPDVLVSSLFIKRTASLRRRIEVGLKSSYGFGKGTRRHRNSMPFRIYYTGEARNSPSMGHHFSLSFEQDTYAGTNAYLPLIFVSLDSWDECLTEAGKRRGVRVTQAQVCQPRDLEVAARPRFACTFISNPEPIRLRAVEMLSRVGEVEVFGEVVGRPVASKRSVATMFRHILCFENTLSPGYVTEKALDAWSLGSVPLWRGLDTAGVLNPRAIVNAYDFSSLTDFVDHVAWLEKNPEKMNEIVQEPLILSRAPLEEATALLRAAWATFGGWRP